MTRFVRLGYLLTIVALGLLVVMVASR